MNCKELTSCLCCTGENLRTILDLGAQSPANNYNVTEKFPLRLNVCLDCSHAQLSHSVNPDILFKDYPYMSGVSETMKEHYKWFATEVTKDGIRPNVCSPLSVYEIACNDGSQLDAFKSMGCKTHGIDPAENLHSISSTKGHNVRLGYFIGAYDNERHDVVVAQNVLAHVADPFIFLMNAQLLMHKDSILCIQTSQAKMLENYQADTIYHEHISFFNKRSFATLLGRCGLEIVEYKFLTEIHGGSDLYILKKLPEISILDYSEFSTRCYQFADKFRKKIEGIQKGGKKVICYGAAAKMINLIRFTGIKPDFIIDDTPTKAAKTISDGLYVHEPKQVLQKSFELRYEPHYIIPVWNFYEEIKAKVEKAYPGKFKFIKYIPEIVIE